MKPHGRFFFPDGEAWNTHPPFTLFLARVAIEALRVQLHGIASPFSSQVSPLSCAKQELISGPLTRPYLYPSYSFPFFLRRLGRRMFLFPPLESVIRLPDVSVQENVTLLAVSLPPYFCHCHLDDVRYLFPSSSVVVVCPSSARASIGMFFSAVNCSCASLSFLLTNSFSEPLPFLPLHKSSPTYTQGSPAKYSFPLQKLTALVKGHDPSLVVEIGRLPLRFKQTSLMDVGRAPPTPPAKPPPPGRTIRKWLVFEQFFRP